jgi:eukaryotic-like serine/threonine-protein kinase
VRTRRWLRATAPVPEAVNDAAFAGRTTFPEADPFPRTAPVGSFPPERFGLYDLSGNVAEWACDVFDPGETTPALANALLRGPAWNDGTPADASFARQRPAQPKMRLAWGGARLVLVLNPPAEPADKQATR